MVKLSYKQENIIKVSDFAMVKKGAEQQFGFKEGTTVYVAGSYWDQSTTDPYKYRLLFVVGPVEDNHLNLVKGGHLMDGKYLRKIKGKRAENLRAIFEEDFKPEEKESEQPAE
jgi:hypothetical protein